MGYTIKYASRADRIFYKIDRLNNLIDQNYKCFYCGCDLTRETVTTDHVIPLSKTGRCHNTNNTVAACDKCNSAKGDQEELITDWFDALIKRMLVRTEERIKLAEWRLAIDPKGSFRKWKKFHAKNNN